MKYYYLVEGLLRNNIGDVLQGMVAEPFLPPNSKPLDREGTKNADPTEKALAIANGWYMHDFDSFPPPKNITPLYISVHIADSQMLKIERIREHFKNHAPIGCRDDKTLKLFLGWGIPAYYSGCLTVTTKKRAKINTSGEGEAILVDNVDHQIPEKVKEKLESLIGQKLIRVSHDPPNIDGSFSDYVSNASAHMNILLERYCKAKIIITTKIHCTLPCLGMGANVMLIHPNPSDPRLATVKEFMDIFSFEDVLNMEKMSKNEVNHEKLKHRQNFLNEIVRKSVEAQSNILQTSQGRYYVNLRKSSFRKAKLYRIAVLLMAKFGIKKDQLRKVYDL